MLCSVIDTDKLVPQRHELEDSQLRSCNAVLGYHRHASDSDAVSGHEYDQPIAPMTRRTAAEAAPVVDAKTAYRSGPLRQTLCGHPRGRQILPATSTEPGTVLDHHR